MAVTEITKILFRRGKSEDRAQLELFGGLANGEPGFTSAGGWWEGLKPSKHDDRSSYIQKSDIIEYPGDGGGDFFIGGPEGADIYIGGSSSEKHLQRYFVSLRGTGWNTTWSEDADGDATKTEDIGFVNGMFTVGRPGGRLLDPGGDLIRTEQDPWVLRVFGNRTTSRSHLYNPVEPTIDDPETGVELYPANWKTDSDFANTGWNASSNSNVRMMRWLPEYEALELYSNSALKIPAGTKDQRPGRFTVADGENDDKTDGSGDFSDYKAQTGMIRFNTTDEMFEGFNGTDWGSLGGAISKDKRTYITVDQLNGSSGCAESEYTGAPGYIGNEDAINFVVNCSHVATLSSDKLYFHQDTDISGSLTVDGTTTIGSLGTIHSDLNASNYQLRVGGSIRADADVVAFATSDQTLKDDITTIKEPIEKLRKSKVLSLLGMTSKIYIQVMMSE